MSKIPYVTQQDSPNLVIVPTESCYEPSPKKTKLDNTSSSTNVPEGVQTSANSVLVKNAGVKVNPRVSSINQNVLIDVSRVKRQPNSWATNFLQSIGGSASKQPRAYNRHSSASKLAILRNENIQPINYLPIAHPEMYKNTTKPNTNKEAIQLKSIKECTPAKTNTNASQPEPNKDFSPSSGTNETTKSKTPCFQPKPNTESHLAIDNKARLLPTVEKKSSHLKSFKEASQTKTNKEPSQLKSTKVVTDLTAKKELSHLIATKKNTKTKEILQKTTHKEAEKQRGNSETCREKIHSKASEAKVHKEKSQTKTFKDTSEKKPSKTQTAAVNRENHELKKNKVEGEKSRAREKLESSSDKNKKSKEDNSKKIKRESSIARKSTSPLRSVVKKMKNYTLDDPNHNEYEMGHNSHNLEKTTKGCNIDLRAKIKRRASKNDIFNKEECKNRDKTKHDSMFPTIPNGKGFAPDDNLIISFDTENDTEEVIEKKYPIKTKTRKRQSGGNKCKKIKLEINIVFQKDYSSDDESPKREDKEDYENNNDLSFLDEINVDEIAEMLNDCQSNIVKIDNLIDLDENKPTLKMDVDLPIINDENAIVRNYESISKGEIIIQNKNANVSGLTLSNENSFIKTEQKAIEIMELQSLTNQNGAAKNNNNDNCELKIKNMLEPQRENRSAIGKTDKLSNSIGGFNIELISNDASNIKENIICVESSINLNVTNSNNIEKFSESVALPAEFKLKDDNILTSEVKSTYTVNTNSLAKKTTETDKTTNINNDKHVENLAADQNVTLPNDIINEGIITKSDNNSKTTINSVKVQTAKPSIFVENSKNGDDVTVVEDSDNDCYIAEVQGTMCVVEHKINDLASQMGCSLDTKCKEVITVDAVKPKIVENDSEPILILDTDYDVLKTSKKKSEPIYIIKKHLFCNSDNKIHATDKILKKTDNRTLLDQKINTETKKNQDKNTRQNKSGNVKTENDTMKDITPSAEDEKHAASIKATDNITPLSTKERVKSGQGQTQSNTRNHKELNGEEKSVIFGDQIQLESDTKHNTVTQIQAKTNTQDQKDVKLNTDIKCASAEKLISPTNENDDITMWLENTISQDMKRKDGKISDGEKSSTGTQISTAKNNNDSKIRMWVVNKGDTRTNAVEQKQTKANTPDAKDGKPKSVDYINTQNVNAKCQPKVPNKTTAQAASDVSKNAAANEKPDKTNMLVKGDPRTKQNQSKTNSQDTKDGKPKTVNNTNTQNENEKNQPNVQNKLNPQAKGNSLISELTRKHLVQIDQLARRMECRMRVYFGAKYCVTDLIHSGGYSTMYLCKDGNGVTKTVKQIKSSWQMGASQEAMMMRLQHGVPESNYNCVRHYSGFSMAGLWCYIMEYYPKNLQEVMNINNRSFHIDKVQEFSRQLVAAVTVLRNNHVIHSDINPQHILINDSETRIKLCGFDQAFYYTGNNLLPNVGTINYRAPELILGFRADYGIDVWATALVMYEMATNRQLFPGIFNNDILYKQFCTLDHFPYEMLERCYYRDQHFMGDTFVRIVGSRGEGKVLVRDFFKKERIHSVLSQVYFAEWAKFGANRVQEKKKLYTLGKLIKTMLVMDPRSRITIEFVFADPFIYEML